MSNKISAYLACPFFNNKEMEIMKKVAARLRELDYDVYVPQEHTIEGGEKMDNLVWGEAVFSMDIKALNRADVVWVVNFGLYSDSGTAWECGYAYAQEKPITQILVPSENTKKDFSLMMMNAQDEYYYLDDFLKPRFEVK